MERSSLADSTKSTKRKGARSVSTLTPPQLARKRANDREAQRAIRARTKEHIERLERELDGLKSGRSREENVKDLLKCNAALEKELTALRENLGLPTNHLYPSPACEDNLAAASPGVSRQASSFGQNSSDYDVTSAFASTYIATPERCESWTAVLPSVPLSGSSPSPSVGNPDECVPSYLPTSVPTSMVEVPRLPPQPMSCLDARTIDYNDIDSEHEYSTLSAVPVPSNYMQQSWNVYNVYYP